MSICPSCVFGNLINVCTVFSLHLVSCISLSGCLVAIVSVFPLVLSGVDMLNLMLTQKYLNRAVLYKVGLLGFYVSQEVCGKNITPITELLSAQEAHQKYRQIAQKKKKNQANPKSNEVMDLSKNIYIVNK